MDEDHGEASLDPALLELLPEDAPPEHIAYQKCHASKQAKRNYVSFKFLRDGVVIPFQTTLNASGGSQYAAERILRACWVKFEEGASKEQVLQFRDECYERLKVQSGAVKAPAGKPKPSPATGPPDKVASKAAESKPKPEKRPAEAAPQTKVKETPGKAAPHHAQGDAAEDLVEGSEPPLRHVLEDAPDGHDAHRRCMYDEKSRTFHFHASIKGAKAKKTNFRVSSGSSGGSVDDAGRITRLCFLKWEQGATLDELTKYRSDCYVQCGGRKRQSDETGKTPGLTKKVRKDGSGPVEDMPAGAVRVEGRSKEKKNASINGVYVPLEAGCEGSTAYEKQQDGEKKRFLYFSAAKSRWKISNKLGEEHGFAYALVDDGGKASPAGQVERVRWMVMDGKDEGYKEDAGVRCVQLAPSTGTEPRGRAADKDHPGAGQPEEKSERASANKSGSTRSSGSSKSSASDSDSDAGSSASGARAPAAEERPPAAAEVLRGAAMPLAAAAAPAALPGAALAVAAGLGPAPRKGKICAKMLVRSRLRCACHFMYVQGCPNTAVRL